MVCISTCRCLSVCASTWPSAGCSRGGSACCVCMVCISTCRCLSVHASTWPSAGCSRGGSVHCVCMVCISTCRCLSVHASTWPSAGCSRGGSACCAWYVYLRVGVCLSVLPPGHQLAVVVVAERENELADAVVVLESERRHDGRGSREQRQPCTVIRHRGRRRGDGLAQRRIVIRRQRGRRLVERRRSATWCHWRRRVARQRRHLATDRRDIHTSRNTSLHSAYNSQTDAARFYISSGVNAS